MKSLKMGEEEALNGDGERSKINGKALKGKEKELKVNRDAIKGGKCDGGGTKKRS